MTPRELGEILALSLGFESVTGTFRSRPGRSQPSELVLCCPERVPRLEREKTTPVEGTCVGILTFHKPPRTPISSANQGSRWHLPDGATEVQTLSIGVHLGHPQVTLVSTTRQGWAKPHLTPSTGGPTNSHQAHSWAVPDEAVHTMDGVGTSGVLWPLFPRSPSVPGSAPKGHFVSTSPRFLPTGTYTSGAGERR